MADDPTYEGGRGREGWDGRLDASGEREVVYCHQCNNEWWREEHGLICPRCEGDIIEIVTPDSDPRPIPDEQPPHPLHDHNPWEATDSDPEEADIEEHVMHGPGGSMFFSQTVRMSRSHGTSATPPRRDTTPHEEDPGDVMRGFQNLVGTLMGPGFHPGQAGRSGPDTLFPPPIFGGNTIRIRGSTGRNYAGERFSFNTGPIRPRATDGPQQGPRVDDLATYEPSPRATSPNGRPLLVIVIRSPPDRRSRILGGIFGGPGVTDENGQHHAPPGMPPGLQALLAAMLNPANAHSGDAVYSQEALDQIISTLMEQHPTSNAPGPASPDAIGALPKKKLDEIMLGPEGKGECSVCMDDVKLEDEVVVLPCSHWFHETCAGAWLSEHNTCPICRKGIEGGFSSPTPSSSSNDPERRRSSTSGRRLSRSGTSGHNSRNEARLDAIRNSGRLTPTQESEAPRRWHIIGDPSRGQPADEDISRSRTGNHSTSIFARSRGRDDQYESRRSSRAGHTSSREHSPQSRRSSNSGGRTAGSSTGPFAWLRDRFGSNNRRYD